MYAKSFIAFNTNGRFTSVSKASLAPDGQYFCHLCSNLLKLHVAENRKSPWFEHVHISAAASPVRKLHSCPYISPDAEEVLRVTTLRQFVPDARPLVSKADRYCTRCRSDYHGEKYCTHCQTGIYSVEKP
ncbi:putative zinc ribbon protein [Rahnella sp. PCH160]|uniref:putative zinc ribbon protein n=1 Tax=Rahnella sp. PCH160 TaxID=3447928 RepID=UPI0039FC7F2F